MEEVVIGNAGTNKQLCLAYVIEHFPSQTEYFILNEIFALEKRGVRIVILAIREPQQHIHWPNLQGLQAPVIYPSYIKLFLGFFRLLKHLKRAHGFDVSLFHFKDFLKQWRNFSIAVSFEQQLKNSNITHVHAHFAFIATDVGCIMSKLIKVPFSFTAHAQDIFTNQKYITKKIEQATFVLTCTMYNQRFLNQLTNNRHHKKIYRVYHGIPGVDTNIILKGINRTETIRLLTVARLIEKKGIEYLLKAVKLLICEGIKVSCTIIGDGPLKNRLIQYAANEGISNCVVFLGRKSRNEVLQTIAASDIFVLPCCVAANGDMDGLPNVLLEAMLMEVPVVSTNVSAIPELIEHNRTGLLVPEKDEFAITNAILTLIHDMELYNFLVKNAKDNITLQFNINNSTSELIRLFQKYGQN